MAGTKRPLLLLDTLPASDCDWPRLRLPPVTERARSLVPNGLNLAKVEPVASPFGVIEGVAPSAGQHQSGHDRTCVERSTASTETMRDRPGLRPTIRAARRPVDRRHAPRTAGPPPPGRARVGTPVYQVLGCLLLLDERMGVPGLSR